MKKMCKYFCATGMEVGVVEDEKEHVFFPDWHLTMGHTFSPLNQQHSVKSKMI